MKEEASVEFPEKEESPARQFIKRTIVILFALFLILLMVTYIAGYYAFSYLGSRAESVAIEQQSLTFHDAGKNIIFDESVYSQLQEIYFANLEHEFKVCLFGSVTGDTYYSTSLVEPEIFSQSPFHVSAEPCAPDAIIDIHSHPYQKCIASAQDISYLRRLKEVNPLALMAVMCAKDRMSFYA